MGFGLGSILGGGGSESTSSSQSGILALPPTIANRFYELAGVAENVMKDADQYYRPMDLTAEEQLVQSMIQPDNVLGTVSQYLNPYRDILTQDINREYEDILGAAKSDISQAGAFGSTRAKDYMYDVERARQDALASALAGQYDTAFNQSQTGMQNLLGFGGFQRQLDLSQRQALPTAGAYLSQVLSPTLNASTSTQTQTEGGDGILGNVGGLMSGIGSAFGGGSLGSLFGAGSAAAGAGAGAGTFGTMMANTLALAASDENVKENIEPIGVKNGYPIYKFNYKGDAKKWIGVMAQDIELLKPEAVIVKDGIKHVDYSQLGLEMVAA